MCMYMCVCRHATISPGTPSTALTAVVDAKDPYTCGHSERVGLLASQLARKIGLDARECENYRISGLVHDIGKIGVPEAVLLKPTHLTEEEFDKETDQWD